ncbi:MAG: hypothetical protein WDN45_07030 [Caulobacteraceae bacterium]
MTTLPQPPTSAVARNALMVIAVIASGAALFLLRSILTPLLLAGFLMVIIDGLSRVFANAGPRPVGACRPGPRHPRHRGGFRRDGAADRRQRAGLHRPADGRRAAPERHHPRRGRAPAHPFPAPRSSIWRASSTRPNTPAAWPRPCRG